MIRIAPEQKCSCRRPHPSGRYYLGREACGACGLFIVLSPAEIRELMELELAQARRERALMVPAAAEIGAGDDFERMYPNIAKRIKGAA